MDNIEEVISTTTLIGLLVANFLLNTDRIHKAIELCNECLIILNNNTQGKKEELCKIFYIAIFYAYLRISDYTNATIYGRKLLVLLHKSDDKVIEGKVIIPLAKLCESENKFTEAKNLYETAINIMMQTGDKEGEADACGKLSILFFNLSEYSKAKEYIERALAIRIEIGDRQGEATCYGNLGTVFSNLGEYVKTKEYLEKALAIRIEIGDRQGEAADYGNLGIVFSSLGEYLKAKEFLEKALAIRIEIGDRSGQAADYGNLATVFSSLGEYVKAKEYLEKAIAITIEIGHRVGEASCYGNLGTVYISLGKYVKAKECLEKALAIRIEIGDRSGEAADYGNLGTVFSSLGEYVKAKEYLEKALAIRIEIGDRKGEASCYGNLGTVFSSLGEYLKAKEFLEKALAIKIEIGDRSGEASSYGNLGTVFCSLGEYAKAKEFLEKALAIKIDIGDRKGEASCYGNLGTVFSSLGEYVKAKEYQERALAIRIEIGDRGGEASDQANLGILFRSFGDYKVAGKYLEKALFISRAIGDSEAEFKILLGLALSSLSENKLQDAFLFLYQCIEKFEDLRNFLGVNDQFKTSFLEESGRFPYQVLSILLSAKGNPREALYVEELRRARGLADLMASQYSIKTHISANPQSWVGLDNIMRKENKSACLYISYFQNDVQLWVLNTSGAVHFKRESVDENFVQAGFLTNLSVSEVLAKSFRRFGFMPEAYCEDRSLNVGEPQRTSPEQESSAPSRPFEVDDEEIIEEISSLSLCYKIFIAPVDDLLEEPEVIVVPDRSLYKVPFAALSTHEGEYLSETRRIRIVPSLTTLKIIQDIPADYHSQTGALIVGDPQVGWVMYKGNLVKWTPLSCARKEAEMVGRLVGVTPLLGEQATKQAVLEKITSVSLIHFAAHGDAERGEIALSPIPFPNCSKFAIQEEDYLLKMADISRVKVRAKLVVLSCCHSGSGQVRAEGIIGIARAFLASGARSVLVALWAIEDTATEQLMRRFYEHLVSGESASESLHQAMKWMRNNGFTKVSQWAPFVLIGDNVSFEFQN